MNKLHQEIKKLSATMVFIAAIMTSTQVLAESATLNGLEISSSNSRGYDIVLNTDTQANVQKKSATTDTLVLDLKNTKVSKDTNTVYKNANGIEHVILKPEANNLQIEINGKSAGSSNVSINNDLAALPKDYNNTVFINKPLNAYAPVNKTEEEVQSMSVITLLRSIKNSPTLRSILNSSNIGWLACFALMFGFLVMTNRKSQARSQVNVKIGGKEEDDNKILKAAMERKEGLIAEGLGTQRRTQLRPRPQDAVSAQRTNYGLKAYNQPTGANTSSFRIQSSPMQKEMAPSAALRRPLRATTATAQELKEDIKKNEVHIDNVKFLESMAKIYERSGRVDLANGLANNIKKAKNIR